jgi:hypothetical protein
VQGFTHQVDIALCQVPHTSVNQLCRTARGAFREIIPFEQQGFESPRGSINCTSQSCSPTADYYNIELCFKVEFFQLFLSVHGVSGKV